MYTQVPRDIFPDIFKGQLEIDHFLFDFRPQIMFSKMESLLNGSRPDQYYDRSEFYIAQWLKKVVNRYSADI